MHIDAHMLMNIIVHVTCTCACADSTLLVAHAHMSTCAHMYRMCVCALFIYEKNGP